MSNLYPHNQEIYDGILKAIADGYKKIGYTEATGLGKSFVFIELCKTIFKGKKILYVVPKVCISEAITFYKEYDFISDCVDFTTYAMFNSEDKALEFAEKYDVLFADECHHLLSDIQGCNVDICGSLISDKAGGFYIGMTASYLIKGVNILDKYFDNTIYGNNLYDAIIEGIYPKMDYCLAIPELDDVPKDLLIKYNIDCTKSMLSSILSDKVVNKILVFFPNKKELLYNIDSIRNLFKGYRIFTLYSEGFSKDDNLNTVSEFNECNDKCILLSISMLLEGVHAKGVDCALIYRNVTKLHTLEQLIGRLFYYGMTKSPLIVDVTGSIKLFNSISANGSKVGRNVIKNIREVFNPNCSKYSSIDFLEAYANSRKSVYEFDYSDCSDGVYRDIHYPISVYELAKVLGVTHKVIISRMSDSKKFNFIVDYFLDDYKKKRKPLVYILEEEYKGIQPFNSKAELNKIFPKHWIYDYYSLREEDDNVSLIDFLDYCIDRDRYRVSEDLFICPQEGYEGLLWGSLDELVNLIHVDSSDLMKSYRFIEDSGIMVGRDNLNLVLDYAIENYSKWILPIEYRGIKPSKTYKDLARNLNITVATFHSIKNKKVKSDSIKEIIDYIFDEYFIFNEEYRGVKPCANFSDIDTQLGLRKGRFAKYLYEHEGVSIFDAIDHYLNIDKEKEVKEPKLNEDRLNTIYHRYILDEEYRGIPKFSTLTEFKKYVPFSVISEYIKTHENFSCKDIIDYFIDVKGGEDYKSSNSYLSLTEEYRGVKPFRGTNQLANQLGLSPELVRGVFNRLQKRNKDLGLPKLGAKDLVDSVLDSKRRNTRGYSLKSEYRGIKPFTSLSGLSSQVNIPRNRLNKIYLELSPESIEAFLDYVLDYVVGAK